ncbi:MAG: HipA domain-containing protein [Candidatus Acidiferrales bacterium]
MDRQVFVYVDLDGVPHLAGSLWGRARKGKQGATFEYNDAWLKSPNRFSLEPALTLGPGPFHTNADRAMFGAIGDSAPDTWGRVLMRRMANQRARTEGQTSPTLTEMDYLLLVDDEARAGALRFAETEGGPFLTQNPAKRIPPIVELPRLLSAAEHVMDETDTDEDLQLLIAPGSSLGGARPKASIREKDGHLAIAKFPRNDDTNNTVVWEAVALALAHKAGIVVPRARVETVANKPVLLARRFDREGKHRIPFLSAMSMLGAKDGEPHSYLEIVDALRQHGADPKEDIEALWRRVVFNILISNVDDHLRNHAFLYDGGDGWRLSPAYDLNPVPTSEKPRILSTTINEDDGTASLPLAMSVAKYFELDDAKAKQIAREVGKATSTWRAEAEKHGLGKNEIARMASAFEHEDLKAAANE